MPSEIRGKTRIFLDLSGIDPSEICGNSVVVDKETAHHLEKVLRLSVGDPVEVVCRVSKNVFLGSFSSQGSETQIQLKEMFATEALSPKVKSLCFAICKGDKNDLVCEKATELGVERLVIWKGDHSQVKIPPSDGNKYKRWTRIVESAARQSKKSYIPSLHCISSLEQVLGDIKDFSHSNDVILWCSLSSDAMEMRNLKELPAGGVHVIVGPEGDFSKNEISLLRQSQAHEVTLGPSVLRSETAAITSVAMVQALWGFTE